jgi:hypothetical protein
MKSHQNALLFFNDHNLSERRVTSRRNLNNSQRRVACISWSEKPLKSGQVRLISTHLQSFLSAVMQATRRYANSRPFDRFFTDAKL